MYACSALVDIYIYIFLKIIFHVDIHYVCMLVQRFEPQGRRFKISIIIIINRPYFCSRAVQRGRFIATAIPSHAILLRDFKLKIIIIVINVRQVLKLHF